MKLLKIQNFFKIFTDLKFALFILAFIAISSAIGSVIEQDESREFYQENYAKPIYGFIDANFLIRFGLDHIYTTPWFFLSLLTLSICLISCTITRQFPFFLNSKDYFFKKQKNSFFLFPFFVKIQNIFYLKEILLAKIQQLHFYIYQKGNLIYAYKGLIGRISPILVHFSLLLVLGGSFFGAFQNLKAQEILPKGELFHIQNLIRVGFWTPLPSLNTRVNDFWVEYQNNRIRQFYSNLSLLDNQGKEIQQQTISVNNPLRYQSVDFYQSDWNLLGIRVENLVEKKVYELPLFSLQKSPKSWITWINSQSLEGISFPTTGLSSSDFSGSSESLKSLTLVFDQLQNNFFVYDQKGNFLEMKNIGDFLLPNWKLLEILPSTGLLIKYDPSIPIIYLGFAILMITACLSYLPYTQMWVFTQSQFTWLGSTTNRGKIQLEIEFENLIRSVENKSLESFSSQRFSELEKK